MTDAESAKQPARGRGILPSTVALLVGAALGAGGFHALRSGASAEPIDDRGVHAAATEPSETEEAPHGDGGHGSSAPELPGAVHNLGNFTVNLKGAGGGRVLRMEVQVESTRGGEQVVAHQALLRDAVITLVSDYTWADVEGLEGKTRLRDELLLRMNTLLPKPAIDRVYFTDFVVQ